MKIQKKRIKFGRRLNAKCYTQAVRSASLKTLITPLDETCIQGWSVKGHRLMREGSNIEELKKKYYRNRYVLNKNSIVIKMIRHDSN